MAQRVKIPDQEEGRWKKDKADARNEALKGVGRLGIGYNNKDHRQVTNGLDPPLGRNSRINGPKDAHETIKEVD